VISQSGETADTLAAMREAKRRGARTPARERRGLDHRA
jgi:glucosamine 6-phosphate synthetase-like amidotransferase/phosphosugar isomerase protein